MEFDFRVVHKIIPINTLSGKKSKWRDIQSHNRTKVIREKSRGEGSLIRQDTIENVSEPNFFFFTF